ncbi:MAG: DNA mismatch repair endonuclease MutL [Planctomycetaceae bacterium]|nr:DNA mismatch repair endonuclease MutL [Planctomycetaceae bacterium]
MEAAPRIQPLSASLVNKIAAGEVIERPANVVKELLENSVDALATRIDVDIEQGGSELIRITDDGEGIHPDDLLLAVSSHATSKLREADDLFRVQTMGFRGEALASIAEVSRLRMRSRQPESLEGYELNVDAGERSEPRPSGCPVGTQIEVRQLFLNTPVRRKFLKTQSTEFGHIAEQFTRVALAHPQLHMRLRHNDKTVYDLPAAQGLGGRLEMFYGRQLAEQLIEVDAEHNDVRLWGYVAHPSQSKATRKGQYLFLNGRWIQDRSLQHALSEAFRGLLMVGRHPIAFLFLELSPDEVDVNVHPTKSEVRFRDAQQLYRLLLSTVRNRFLGMDLDSQLSVGQRAAKPQAAIDPARQKQVQRELVAWAKDELTSRVEEWQSSGQSRVESSELREAGSNVESRALSETGLDSFASSESDLNTSPFATLPPDHIATPPSDIVHVETGDAEQRPASEDVALRAMQMHDCYLVVATSHGLTVIDQHALHERIMYERLRNRMLAKNVEVQRMLVPITVEVSAREAALLDEHSELLHELGVQIDQFGGTTVALSGLPTLLRRATPEELVRSVIDLLDEQGSNASRRDLLDSLLHMMSCKAAIKAGQRLSAEEINALLAQRHLIDDAHHCPHGRPTALTLSRDELDRQFGRLG